MMSDAGGGGAVSKRPDPGKGDGRPPLPLAAAFVAAGIALVWVLIVTTDPVATRFLVGAVVALGVLAGISPAAGSWRHDGDDR